MSEKYCIGKVLHWKSIGLEKYWKKVLNNIIGLDLLVVMLILKICLIIYKIGPLAVTVITKFSLLRTKRLRPHVCTQPSLMAEAIFAFLTIT